MMTSHAPMFSKIKLSSTTKELSNLVIGYQCVSRRWMDEGARNLRKIGSFKGTNYSRTAMCHIYVNTQYISTKFGIHVRYVNST